MLENNPVLRERVLGVTAISAILIGGAVGLDTMLTSGWQIGGGDNAHAAYADATPQQYFDDLSRDWTITPPRRVELASADAGAISLAQARETLDGASEGALIHTAVVPAAPVPAALVPAAPVPIAPDMTAPPPQAATPQASRDLAMAAQSQAADPRFDAIEADIQQANPQARSSQSTKDPEPSTPSDNQG